MGGNAFTIASSVFPRMPAPVYGRLKERLLQRISGLYDRVTVPREAPGKEDHGDLDFLVLEHPNKPVTHAQVQEALRASHVLPFPGARTSHYAISITDELDWPRPHDLMEDRYFQVDVHVCADGADFESIEFFHSYGDLGMILGLLVRSRGLSLGTHGLKFPDPPNPPLTFSHSPLKISEFMGLDMEVWEVGFHTQTQVFEWVATSRLFDKNRGFSSQQSERKGKTRGMYLEWLDWVHAQTDPPSDTQRECLPSLLPEALVFFNKTEEWEAMVGERETRVEVKKVLNGARIRELTLGGAKETEDWKILKRIADAVRLRARETTTSVNGPSWYSNLGQEEGVARLLRSQGAGAVEELILGAWKDIQAEESVREKLPGNVL